MSRLRHYLEARLGAVWPAAFAAVAIVAAMTPLRQVFFEGAPYARAVVVTVLAVVVASLTRRSWSPAVNLLLGILVGWAVLALALADLPQLAGIPTADGLLAVGTDLATGWSNLLAAPVPVEVSAQLLALPLGLCWAGGYLTVLLVRASRSALVSVLPSLAVVVIALLLGPGRLSIPAGAVIAVAALAHVAARAAGVGVQPSTTAESGSGTQAQLWRFAVRSFVLAGVPAVAVASLVGASLAVTLGGEQDRLDLHESAGVKAQDELTPLSSLASQLLSETETELFTIQFSGAETLSAADLDRVRVATLERYDGALWSSDGVFLPVVSRVREPDASPRSTQEVTGEVRLAPDYGSSYLPVVGLLRQVSGPSLGLNEVTDTLVTGLDIGTPATVSFTTVVPVGPRPAVVSSQGPPTGADFVGLGGLEVPVAFERFADAAAGDLSDPVERVTAMEAAMTDEGLFGYSVARAYSGHSLSILANYLGPEPQPGFVVARQGYAEQAATALAVLARREGLPSRVAVGYLLSDPEAAVNGAVVTVTTADAHAWTEIYLGDEWVAFDPTNRNEREAQEIPVPELDETVAAPPSVDEPIVAPEVRPEPIEEPDSFPLRWLIMLAAIVVLVALPVVSKWIRRRFRRRGVPSKRLTGAWWELRDQLRDRGITVTRSMTPVDLVAAIEPAVSEEASAEYQQFNQLLDHGLFAPAEPAGDAATQAWAAVRRLRRRLAAGQPRWRRLVAPFDPRSLRPPPHGQPPTPGDDESADRAGDGEAIASDSLDPHVTGEGVLVGVAATQSVPNTDPQSGGAS